MTDTRRKLGGRAWARMVAHIVARDPQCTLRYPGVCTGASETADHIVPYSQGGSNLPDNLRGACRNCNWHRGDGTRKPGRIPDAPTDRDRWSRNWTGEEIPWGAR